MLVTAHRLERLNELRRVDTSVEVTPGSVFWCSAVFEELVETWPAQLAPVSYSSAGERAEERGKCEVPKLRGRRASLIPYRHFPTIALNEALPMKQEPMNLRLSFAFPA